MFFQYPTFLTIQSTIICSFIISDLIFETRYSYLDKPGLELTSLFLSLSSNDETTILALLLTEYKWNQISTQGLQSSELSVEAGEWLCNDKEDQEQAEHTSVHREPNSSAYLPKGCTDESYLCWTLKNRRVKQQDYSLQFHMNINTLNSSTLYMK